MSKQDKQNEKRRQPFFWMLLFFVFFLIMAGCYQWNDWKKRQPEPESEQLTRQQAEAVETEFAEQSVSEEIESPYVSPVDFEALRRVNPDVAAWLTIPGTAIDYPVVQTDDNETYLKTDFEGNSSSAGTVYLDCDSEGDLSGRHSVFYGHHMRNGSMFADIVKFKDKEFFEENRQVILYLPDREIRLKTIAALYGDAGGEKRRTKFENGEHLQQYMDEMTKNCEFRELPAHADRLYSFVTCSYEFSNARTILYAVEEEEPAELEYPVKY